METKTIKIIVKPMKTKEGREFMTYRAVTAHGRLITCKFTKLVSNPPQETCFITSQVCDLNLDESREHPVLWVKGILSIQPVAEVYQERNEDKINQWFD